MHEQMIKKKIKTSINFAHCTQNGHAFYIYFNNSFVLWCKLCLQHDRTQTEMENYIESEDTTSYNQRIAFVNSLNWTAKEEKLQRNRAVLLGRWWTITKH